MARLERAAKRILDERPDVVEVRLFGSLARGEARPGSDADLLIVVRATDVPFVERPVAFSPYLGALGLGCDLLVYTEAERNRMRGEDNPFILASDRDGIVLAGRSGPR